MKSANIAEVKRHFSHYMSVVAQGEDVQICKRNLAVARIVPEPAPQKNRTQLGCVRDTVTVLSDLSEPAMDASQWDVLGDRIFLNIRS